MQGALNAGLQVGAYFFTTAINEAEAIEEANWAADRLAGYNVTYPVAIDVEWRSKFFLLIFEKVVHGRRKTGIGKFP